MTINRPSDAPIRVLMVTSAWPSARGPGLVPFLVDQIRSLRHSGIAVDVFPFSGHRNPFCYLLGWLRLHAHCLLHHYDIVHAQFGQSALIALPTHVPLVITFHGSDLQGWVGNKGSYSEAGKLLQWLSRYVARYADQIIVVAQHLASFLPEGLPVKVIPCGVDLGMFRAIPQEDARRRLNLPMHKFLILFAGDPSNPIKRFQLARQACDLIKDAADASLVVAANVPHDQMPVYLSACNVLILTSRHEGSPTIVKEALACNLPVVSTDVGDVAERILHLQDCVVCADDRPITVAKALMKVQSAQRTFGGRPSLKAVSLDAVNCKILAVYQHVLARRGQRRHTRPCVGRYQKQ